MPTSIFLLCLNQQFSQNGQLKQKMPNTCSVMYVEYPLCHLTDDNGTDDGTDNKTDGRKDDIGDGTDTTRRTDLFFHW